MKFEDKLIILRKNRKMSQEQLADELGVSRQAVSKWESGSSYPEMDKLIQIAKIFECTLDDLTNDEISVEKINSKKDKNPLNDIVNEITGIINKSVKMFSNMNSKEIVGLLFFMFLVGLGILILKWPISEIYSLGETFFYKFGDTVGSIVSGFWYFVLGIVYLIAGIMLFFYIYKVKYLDKFEDVKSKKDDVVIEKQEVKDEPKNNETKTETVKKGWGVLRILGMIVMFFVKCFCFFFAIPFMIMYVFIVFGLFLSIYLTINGVLIFGIILLLIATITLTSLLLELVFDFIFNKELGNKKRLFIVLIISLGLFGVGFGISALEVSDYKFVNDIPKYYQVDTYTKEIDFNDQMYLNNMYNVEFVTDNNLTNTVRIQVNYYDELSTPGINVYDNRVHIVSMDDEFSMDFVKNLIKDLREKTIYNYEMLTNYKITVYTSNNNINLLKKNYEKQAIANEEYIDEISEYQNEIERLQQRIYELESSTEFDQNKLDECEVKLEEYKTRIKDIINE